MYISISLSIYIYIYIERERERCIYTFKPDQASDLLTAHSHTCCCLPLHGSTSNCLDPWSRSLPVSVK